MKTDFAAGSVKLRKVDRQIGLAFHKIARFRGRYFDHVVSPLGLTHAQVFVINHLLRSDGLTQVELAGRLDLGTVTVSGLIDRLAAQGWVTRQQDASDRRSRHIYLTDKAKANVGPIYSAIAAVNKASLDGLTDEEVAHLISLLGRVEKNLCARVKDLNAQT